jgi:NADP-dependent 3-hydroxy acid dehydrogenase YdfG
VQGQAVYAGTKAAVLAISDGLRQELAGKVRVTVILPGYTNTDFPSHIRDPKLRAQMEHSREQFAMSPDAVARAMAYAIDEPDDVNIGETKQDSSDAALRSSRFRAKVPCPARADSRVVGNRNLLGFLR